MSMIGIVDVKGLIAYVYDHALCHILWTPVNSDDTQSKVMISSNVEV